MSAVCPNGHTSVSTDYCDVCGAPIEAGAGSGAASSAPAGGTGAVEAGAAASGQIACPNCTFPAAAGALFCENCGYDFTTGSLPEPAASAAPSAPTPSPVESSALSLDPPSGAAAPAGTLAEGAAAEGEPAGVTPASTSESGSTPAPGGLSAPPPAGEDQWVVEIWIDPDWYKAQKAEDPLPSAGLPGLVVLRQRTVLVGRPSASRGIHPQVDCGADSGVSRRHCQLNTDGQRWWVEDLQSSNGTYLSPAGAEMPTDPIPPGQRREVSDGDRIYVGGWTRLVIRKALPGEA